MPISTISLVWRARLPRSTFWISTQFSESSCSRKPAGPKARVALRSNACLTSSGASLSAMQKAHTSTWFGPRGCHTRSVAVPFSQDMVGNMLL